MTFKSEGKEGILDQTGRVVISPRFESISPGFDGNGRYVMKVDGRFGVLDLNDRWVIPPEFYRIEWKEAEGRFWVMEGKLARDYFYHGRDGQRIGPIPREEIWREVAQKPFGLTTCFQNVSQDVYGFCDREGNEAIPYRYDMAFDFSREAGLARVKRGGKFGYVDPEGNEVVPPEYDDAYDYDEGKRAVVLRSGGWGVLDETGAAVIPTTLEAYPSPVGEDAYFAKSGGKWGIISRDGRQVLPPELDDVKPFNEGTGLAWAQRDGRWGMITTQGEWAVQPSFDGIGPFSPGGALAPVILNGRFAVVDSRGRVIARSVVECGREAVRDAAGAVSWPPDFSCGS
jgi:hypothetical protein